MYMFFSKLRNILINHDTVEGIKEFADTGEKLDPISPVIIPPEDSIFEVCGPADIFTEVSDALQIDPNLLRAFVKVEAGGTNILNGRVIVRWESHWFKKYTGVVIKVHGKRGLINKECQDNEWEALERAAYKLQDAKWIKEAFMSASFGLPQVMGFHYKRLGFSTPIDLMNNIQESEDNAIRVMGKFIQTGKKLLKACQEKNYHLIATYYNGKHYKKYSSGGVTYADKIQNEYERLTDPV